MIPYVIISAVLVFITAAVMIGRETRRLDALAPEPVLDLTEAVVWIEARLPGDVRAQITYGDVRDIVDWHITDMAERGVAPTVGPDGKLVIVGAEDSVDVLVMRLMSTGRDVAPAHVKAVLDGELNYLVAIGAIGPAALEAPRTFVNDL
jgi:hypothetical protein